MNKKLFNAERQGGANDSEDVKAPDSCNFKQTAIHKTIELLMYKVFKLNSRECNKYSDCIVHYRDFILP